MARKRPTYLKTPKRAIIQTVDGKAYLEFKANPAVLDRVEAYELASSQAPGATDARRQYVGGSERVIQFQAILNGIDTGGSAKVLNDMAKLETLTYPDTDDDIANTMFVPPPRVLLTYGSRTWEGFITMARFNEDRHDENLDPILVYADITFVIDMLDSRANVSAAAARRARAVNR